MKKERKKRRRQKCCGDMLLACENEMRKLRIARDLAREQRDRANQTLASFWIITDQCYWYNHGEEKRNNHWVVVKNKKGKKKRLRAGSKIIILKEKL